MLWCWFLLVILAVWYLYLNAKLFLRRNEFKHFPSLPLHFSPWWFLGHLSYLRKRCRPEKSIVQVFWDAHKEVNHGEIGNCVFHLFTRDIIFTVDLSLIGVVLTDHANFLKSKDMHTTFAYAVGRRLFGKYGMLNDPGTDIWRAKRRLMDPAFHKNFLRIVVDDMNSIAVELVRHLNNKQMRLGESTSFDIAKDLCRVALAMICKSGFDYCVEENLVTNEESASIQAIRSITSCVQNRFNFRFTYDLPWMFRKEKEETRRGIDMKRGMAKAHLVERLESERSGKVMKQDILSYIMKSNQCSDELTIDDIVDDFIVFVVAGMETTGVSMGIILFFVLKNPHVYSKLKNEVDTVFGDKATLSFDDISSLVYLEQVIKETLRLVAPVPASSRENMHSDQIVGGRCIPKGAFIMIPTFGLHIVEEYWEDPLKFNPDRFGPGQKIKPYTYMPFMAGPRSCIGKNFAMLEMKIIVSQIIRNFELIDPTPAIKELETITTLTTKPKNGVFIQLKQIQV